MKPTRRDVRLISDGRNAYALYVGHGANERCIGEIERRTFSWRTYTASGRLYDVRESHQTQEAAIAAVIRRTR